MRGINVIFIKMLITGVGMVNEHYTYTRMNVCVQIVLKCTCLATMNDHNLIVINIQMCIALWRYKLFDNVTLL